jgi:hypothetical protein
LCGVRSASGVEVEIGFRKAEFPQKRTAQRFIVVLPGMYKAVSGRFPGLLRLVEGV